MHYLSWQPSFRAIQDFRRSLNASLHLPVKTELHTRHLLLNKTPFTPLALPEADRIAIVDLHCDLIANLDLRIVNVAIVKPRIANPTYRVLDTALTYSVQRIENDLDPAHNPSAKFLIVTDPGREGKMRRTTRRIQRINFIPSKFAPVAYRREITTLIEDPLPKDSKESYFIQLADLVSYVVYLYGLVQSGASALPARLPPSINAIKVLDWMTRLAPRLNVQATQRDPFGVVFHP
jgi:hypothetical protein